MRATSEIFEILRPKCVNLTRSYQSVSADDVKEFMRTLEKQKLDCLSFQELQEYLLFPLKLILSRGKSEVQIQALTCAKYILDNTLIKSWDLFYDFFTQLLMLISVPKETITVCDVCEEVKVAVVQCMTSLVTHSSISIKEQMYREEFHLPLSHAIYVLLCLSEKETSKSLKLISVEMIGKFIEMDEWDTFHYLAADRFAAFLPGITSCLVRIISTDFHQGQALTVAILQVLGKLITLVLSDNSLTDCHINSEKAVQNKTELNIPMMTRDDAWKRTTAENLETLIRKIATQVCHSHWKVRLALVEFSRRILFGCTSSLQNCISPLLEVCLVLSVDDYDNIAKESSLVLSEFSNHHVDVTKREILDIMEDDLHNLVTRLPRILNGQDEKQILLSTNLLLGYLHLFGPEIKYFLQSVSHQKRFIIALLHLAELDKSNVEDKVVIPYEHYEEMQDIHWPKKSFKYFRNDSIYKSLRKICCTLMQNGDHMLLTDCLMEKVQVPMFCQQSLLIINELLFGLESRTEELCCEEDMETIRLFMEIYFSQDFFNVKVSNDIYQHYGERNQECQQCNLSAEKLNANMQQVCLLLEGIANMAKVAGSKFRPFLMQALFPLMEKAGSPSFSVSHAARLALWSIAKSCKYDNLQSLITENADYLVNKLSLELQHHSHSQSAIVVFQVSLQLCNDNILSLFQDVIDEVLYIVDLYHREAPVIFVKLIHVLVTAIRKWHPDLTDKEKETKDKNTDVTVYPQSGKNDAKQIWEIFLEYHKNKQISEEFFEKDDLHIGDSYDDMLGNSNNEKEKEHQIPLHIAIVKKILERCVHLQSSRNSWARIFTLEAISDALLVMKNYEDELLPLVHNLWSGFVYRFCDEELVVATKAFDTLLIMADTCRSFICRRTVQDIWPKLIKFLGSQSKVSLQKDDDSNYRFTVGYKLQLKLLSDLGHLALKLEIQEKELELLIRALHPYISSIQPKTLQEATVRAFKILMEIDVDAVWLCLNDCCSYSPEMSPLHYSFYPVYFPQPQAQYKKNTEILLQYALSSQ